MHVWPLSVPDHAANPLRRGLDALICSVGTDSFEDILFHSARQLSGCEHLTAFLLDEEKRPRVLLATSAGAPHLARKTGETYVSHFWHMDPVNRLCEEGADLECGFLTRSHGEEVRRASFRRHCYNPGDWTRSGAKLFDRLSIIRRRGREVIKISFHRAQSAGPFGDHDIGHIAAAADFLVPLVLRHGMSAPPVANVQAFGFYIRAVRARVPQLSRREAEVCAGIVLGVSSEGIASMLGISLNTVRTYRKRAYARLGISSQNQLMKLVMPHPILD